MVARILRLSSLPLPVGLGLGAAAAVGVALAPAGWVEGAVEAASIPALLPAAAPPLGAFARALLAGGAGLCAGAVAWAASYLLVGPGGPFARDEGRDGMPTVRRADAHPDAPPRRILSATELGAPPPPIAAPAAAEAPDERPLPVDLDQPLSSFDPGALRLRPMEAGAPVPPLAIRREPLGPGERIRSVELPAPAPGEPETPSIDSLLRRLEQGTRAKQDLRRAG